MSNTVETERGRRDRSPSFPFIPLPMAIERLVEFEEHHKRVPVPPDRVGPAWGLKANSSQAQQTLAALKAFGLLETRRGDSGRSVAVSERGRKYLLARQDSTKQEVLREAALRPKQIETYWVDWKHGRPKDDACLDALTFSGGFSRDGAEKFLKVYDDTIAYAGLVESDKLAEGDEPTPVSTSEHEGINDKRPTLRLVPIGAAAREEPKVSTIMEGERVVFIEEASPQRYVKVVAAGEIDETLLDALSDYLKRQRKRLNLPAIGGGATIDPE